MKRCRNNKTKRGQEARQGGNTGSEEEREEGTAVGEE